MALARKCDRCGRLYEEPKDGEVCGIRWAIGPHWELGKLLDLYPDCTDKLSGWIEGEEKIPYKKPVIGETVKDVLEPVEDPAEEVGEVITSRADKPLYGEEYTKLRLQGKKPKEIAKMYGISSGAVSVAISSFKKDNPGLYAEMSATGTEGNP